MTKDEVELTVMQAKLHTASRIMIEALIDMRAGKAIVAAMKANTVPGIDVHTLRELEASMFMKEAECREAVAILSGLMKQAQAGNDNRVKQATDHDGFPHEEKT